MKGFCLRIVKYRSRTARPLKRLHIEDGRSVQQTRNESYYSLVLTEQSIAEKRR